MLWDFPNNLFVCEYVLSQLIAKTFLQIPICSIKASDIVILFQCDRYCVLQFAINSFCLLWTAHRHLFSQLIINTRRDTRNWQREIHSIIVVLNYCQYNRRGQVRKEECLNSANKDEESSSLALQQRVLDMQYIFIIRSGLTIIISLRHLLALLPSTFPWVL